MYLSSPPGTTSFPAICGANYLAFAFLNQELIKNVKNVFFLLFVQITDLDRGKRLNLY